MAVTTAQRDGVLVVTIDRPEVRSAVDRVGRRFVTGDGRHGGSPDT